MISRVAEACFWLHRQVERSDAVARLSRVNQGFVLDADLPAERKWYPLLVVCGEHERFDERYPSSARADGDIVREYVTWDTENPTSIVTAIFWARENARTIREVISLDMWEVLNDLWHWLRGGAGRRLFRSDPDAFYRRICDGAAMFQGVCHNTMLHEAPFDFMRLGMLLERAGQTARVLDVHHHTFIAEDSQLPSGDVALARLQWLALLRSCSATGPFLKRRRSAPTARAVAGFLLLDEGFPRSVFHCVDRAEGLLRRIRGSSSVGERAADALAELRQSLATQTTKRLHDVGVHAEVTRIVQQTAEVCQAIHADYFDPAPFVQQQQQHSASDGHQHQEQSTS